MRSLSKVSAFLACLLLAPALLVAQDDPFGVPDTAFAEIAKIDDFNWSVTILYFNDQNVAGIVVPFKMSAGETKVVADSAAYAGGRVEKWAYRGFRPDTADQSVTLGMVANLGPTDHKLTPGHGRLVTVFVSSPEGKKIDELTIDTTTTYPSNFLMTIVDALQGEPPDTIRLEFNDRQVIPAWVVRRIE